MATTVNDLVVNLKSWVDKINNSDLINTIIITTNYTKTIVERNKDIDMLQMDNNIKRMISILSNISNALQQFV